MDPLTVHLYFDGKCVSFKLSPRPGDILTFIDRPDKPFITTLSSPEPLVTDIEVEENAQPPAFA